MTTATCKRCGASENLHTTTINVPGLGLWTFTMCDGHTRDFVRAMLLAALPLEPPAGAAGGDGEGGAVVWGHPGEAGSAGASELGPTTATCTVCGRLTVQGDDRCGYHRLPDQS
jgi:hypothetical protein